MEDTEVIALPIVAIKLCDLFPLSGIESFFILSNCSRLRPVPGPLPQGGPFPSLCGT